LSLDFELPFGFEMPLGFEMSVDFEMPSGFGSEAMSNCLNFCKYFLFLSAKGIY
jgi:hypothetical protein